MDWDKEFKKLEKHQKLGDKHDFYHVFDLKYIEDLIFIYKTKLKELIEYDCEYYETHNQEQCPITKKNISLLDHEIRLLLKIVEVRTSAKC